MKPTILVPFDFSATAESALGWAADLQKSTGAGPLQIVHAINARPLGTAEVSLQALVPNEDETADLEGRMVAAAGAHGAAATAKVLVRLSAVGDIIVDAARAGGADLIVMGTHGRTGVRRLVLGSVAEHVLRHAECPVVSVHAERSEGQRIR
jgi:universal stress protein A